jgi:methyl-accepting chemotaxis protein
MKDIEHTIAVVRLIVATAEALAGAIDKAKHALEAGTTQLKTALLEMEKLRDQLAEDRAKADAALDRKFDNGDA